MRRRKLGICMERGIEAGLETTEDREFRREISGDALMEALSAYNGRARSRCSLRRAGGSMRVEGATHRAADGREVMKRFELLSIIGSMVAVGITLGAVVIGSVGNLRTEMQTLRTEVRTDITDVRTEMQSLRAEVSTEMQALRAEVNTEMQTLRTEVRTDIRALETRLAGVERRQARTEGLLEGLRDAITAQGRGEDPPPAQREAT